MIIFIQQNWLKLLLKYFAPLIFIVFILISASFYSEWIGIFNNFNNIEGNEFVLNNLLLLFIGLSYFTVIYFLFFFGVSTLIAAIKYKGDNKTVQVFYGISILLLIIAFFIICGLVGIVLLQIYTKFTYWTFEDTIKNNHYITLIVFIIFFFLDLQLYFISQIRSKTETEPTKKQKLLSEMNLSKESIWLIDIPMILISLFVIFLSHSISTNGIFNNLFDSRYSIQYQITDESPFKFVITSFTNGFETGMLIASIIFSQIIYTVLQIYHQYKDSTQTQTI
jgi:hypothetical protein